MRGRSSGKTAPPVPGLTRVGGGGGYNRRKTRQGRDCASEDVRENRLDALVTLSNCASSWCPSLHVASCEKKPFTRCLGEL